VVGAARRGAWLVEGPGWCAPVVSSTPPGNPSLDLACFSRSATASTCRPTALLCSPPDLLPPLCPACLPACLAAAGLKGDGPASLDDLHQVAEAIDLYFQ
jgi:hypothetical protein